MLEWCYSSYRSFNSHLFDFSTRVWDLSRYHQFFMAKTLLCFSLFLHRHKSSTIELVLYKGRMGWCYFLISMDSNFLVAQWGYLYSLFISYCICKAFCWIFLLEFTSTSFFFASSEHINCKGLLIKLKIVKEEMKSTQ